MYPILAGVVMHGPGIAIKLKFEALFSQEFAKTLLSAATEGTFLLLLAERMYYISRNTIDGLAQRCLQEDDGKNTTTATTSKFARFKIMRKTLCSGPSIIHFFFLLSSIILALWSFVFTMSSITGDATFRDASGDSDIDANTLRVGMRNAKSHVMASFIGDPLGTVFMIVSSFLCLGGSVCIFAWNRRRERSRPSSWAYASLETETSTKTGAGFNFEASFLCFDGSVCIFAWKRRKEQLRPSSWAYANLATETSIETGVGSDFKAEQRRCGLFSSSPRFKLVYIWVLIVALLLAILVMNSASWYTPVIFAFISVYVEVEGVAASHADFHSLFGKPSNSFNVDLSRAPNIIFIQHESLSGGLMFNTDEGRSAMPFFQKMMHTSPNFYVFEHTRGMSGQTKDALPTLMTGCAPTSKASEEWVQTSGRSLAYDFLSAGYATASFSSRLIDDDINGGEWSMLKDVIAGGVEHLVDPVSYGMPKDSTWSVDERKMVPQFFDWLATVDRKRPFYAQFYNFNQHYPYLVDPDQIKPKHNGSRYFDSLMLTDDFLRSLMEPLHEMGILENTIVVGSGDHGDDPNDYFARLRGLTSFITQPAAYMYYRQSIMPDPSIADRLRRNTQKMISTLDLHPTIKSIVQGGAYDFLRPMHSECLTGVDLTAVDIPDDRVTISWNFVSSDRDRSVPKPQFWAIHTAVDSTEYAGSGDVTLYHRRAKNVDRKLGQGKDNTYILTYGDCVASWTSAKGQTPRCMSEVNEDHKAIFRKAIKWIKHSKILMRSVGDSELVRFFADIVDREETGEVG
jgi:hypothetical protein